MITTITYLCNVMTIQDLIQGRMGYLSNNALRNSEINVDALYHAVTISGMNYGGRKEGGRKDYSPTTISEQNRCP